MVFIYFIGFIYLVIGFIYAVNVLINGKEPIYTFPINMLGGPIVIVQMFILTRKGKRPPKLNI